MFFNCPSSLWWSFRISGANQNQVQLRHVSWRKCNVPQTKTDLCEMEGLRYVSFKLRQMLNDFQYSWNETSR